MIVLVTEAERCPVAGKIKFHSKKDALTTKNKTQELRGKEGAKRVYKCNDCGTYHLTGDKESNGSIKGYNGLKLKNRWEHLLKTQQNDTLGSTTETTQTDKRDEEGPLTWVPSGPKLACDDRLHIEVPGGHIVLAQELQLSGAISSRRYKNAGRFT